MADPYTREEVEQAAAYLDTMTEVDVGGELDRTLDGEAVEQLSASTEPPVDLHSILTGILIGVELARRRPPG